MAHTLNDLMSGASSTQKLKQLEEQASKFQVDIKPEYLKQSGVI